MGKIFKFRKRPRRHKQRLPIGLVAFGLAAGAALGLGFDAYWDRQAAADTVTDATTTFGACGTFASDNCVVDGDTFRYRGQKIRIADIDTPEISPPRCESEDELGHRAKHRLIELLNAGSFQLASISRDEDRYGRKLRIVTRDGRSIGDKLVAEGLARTWGGRREPWC